MIQWRNVFIGWPAVHSTTPTNIVVFTGDTELAIISITLNEVFEATFRTVFGSYVLFPSKDRDLESIAGIELVSSVIPLHHIILLMFFFLFFSFMM